MDFYNRRCIDGSIHGCSVCMGYCRFHEHPGYLTEKMMAAHSCIEKGCHYFERKQPREKVVRPADTSREILAYAKNAVNEFEGMKIMRAESSSGGDWTIYYIAIAEYVLLDVEASLSLALGQRVRFSQLPYSFDNAVRIIMKEEGVA